MDNPADYEVQRFNPYESDQPRVWLPGGARRIGGWAERSRRFADSLLLNGETILEAQKMVGATQKRFWDTPKVVWTRKNTFLAAEKLVSMTPTTVAAFEKMGTELENIFSLSEKRFSASQKRF
jgi:hypothetical protein